ncbi:M81 family metallopeptidase [Pseudomonadales bacterium]|nr:M81 family metallopeptidase [Pseudomonadales bacterium]
MKIRKVAIVGQFLESNRYAAVVKGNRFRVLRGDAIVEDARSSSPKLLKEGQGFFAQMDIGGSWEPIPITLVLGGAGGPAEHGFIMDEIDKIGCALEAQTSLDGVYILNHGAMTTPQEEDPDGLLYETVRRAVGAGVPVVTTVDLHANISQRMVDNADVIVAYRTDPHVDQYERGIEAATILNEMFNGMRPTVSNIRVPIVPPNVSLLTANGPYGDLIDYGQSQIGAEILNISIVAGFAYSDTSVNGLHVLVTARDSELVAATLCKKIAEMAWSMRERFLWNLVPLANAVAKAVEGGLDNKSPPVLLADLGDNVGAGGPGNTLWLTKALHKAKATGVVIGSFFDPELVSAATNAGIGSSIQATFNGDGWEGAESTYIVDNVLVQHLHPGEFYISTGPLSGMRVNAGPMCLLKFDGIQVLVTSRRPIVWPDPELLESMDIKIASIRTLVLKCRSNYRAVYNKYFDSESMIEVDTPGRTSPVLSRHDWKRIPRPSYPLDLDFDWAP